VETIRLEVRGDATFTSRHAGGCQLAARSGPPFGHGPDKDPHRTKGARACASAPRAYRRNAAFSVLPSENFASRGQSSGGRRSRLTLVRLFFAFSRRSLAPRPGVVGRRDGEGGRRASATTAASRARAASLLRNCARCSDAVIVSTPSTRRPLKRSRSRSRWSGERTAEPAASHRSSARESAVFTPCPPGPEERENRQDSSDSGMVIPELTRRPGRWAAGMDPSSSCVPGAPGLDAR
jgi:hypothetical protein